MGRKPYNHLAIKKNKYLNVSTKDNMLPALIGMIAGGFIGSLHGTVTATVLFGILGTTIGILTAHASSIPVNIPDKNTIKKDTVEPDPEPRFNALNEEGYLLIDVPTTLVTALQPENIVTPKPENIQDSHPQTKNSKVFSLW